MNELLNRQLFSELHEARVILRQNGSWYDKG